MPAIESYLIRGPDGRCATQVAQSVRGALTKYLESTAGRKAVDRFQRRHPHQTCYVGVKLRSAGDWEDFAVR